VIATQLAAARAVSTSFGLVMVAAAAVGADGPALVGAGLASVTVLVGNVFRTAATLAVLISVAVIALADAPPMLSALSGLCGAAYLVLRHTATATATAPTVLGAVGFATAGLAAVSIPLQLPWVPLVAPVAVLAVYALVTRPYWADRSTRR
jgi:hypothetical protein